MAWLGELEGEEAEWGKDETSRLAAAVIASLDDEIAELESKKAKLDGVRKNLSAQLLEIQSEVMDCAREGQGLLLKAQSAEEIKDRLRVMEAIQAFLCFLMGQTPMPDLEARETILKFTTENLEASRGIDQRLAEAGKKLNDLAGPWQETIAQLKEFDKTLFALQVELIEFQREHGAGKTP